MPAPILQEPDSEGDLIMASLPTRIRPLRMHATQSHLNNPRLCSAFTYRWRTKDGGEIIGLPTTRVGTPYLPSALGVGWYQLENDTASVAEIYRHGDLLYRNRKTEIWRAAARSAFELRRIVHPLPEVIGHLIGLHDLRISVWATVAGATVRCNGGELFELLNLLLQQSVLHQELIVLPKSVVSLAVG